MTMPDNLEQPDGTPGSPDGSVADGISQVFAQSVSSDTPPEREPEKQPDEAKPAEKVSDGDKTPEPHGETDKKDEADKKPDSSDPDKKEELTYEEAYGRLTKGLSDLEAEKAEVAKMKADLEKQSKGLSDGMREKSEIIKEAMQELGLGDAYNRALDQRRQEKKVMGDQRPPADFQRLDYLPDKAVDQLAKTGFIKPIVDRSGREIVSAKAQVEQIKPVMNAMLNTLRFHQDQQFEKRIEELRSEYTPVVESEKRRTLDMQRAAKVVPEVQKFAKANKLTPAQQQAIYKEFTSPHTQAMIDSPDCTPEMIQARLRQAAFDPAVINMQPIPDIPAKPPEKKTAEAEPDPGNNRPGGDVISRIFRTGTR